MRNPRVAEILSVIADGDGEQGAQPARLGAECLSALSVSGVGVLDLYRDTPGPLAALELADALAFADAATVVVLHLQDRDEHGGVSAGLTGPIDSQAEVHQATGMITIQLGISLAEALLRLRAHAIGQTVSAVAADVVNRRLYFDDSESGTTVPDTREPGTATRRDGS